MYFCFWAFFEPFLFSCHIVYPFSLFVMSLVAIFLFKIIRFLLHLVVGMFSCHLLPVVDRIFLSRFGMSCFVCIILPFVDISLISFFRQYFLVYFLKLYCYFFLCSLFLFVPMYSSIFPLFYHFGQFS